MKKTRGQKSRATIPLNKVILLNSFFDIFMKIFTGSEHFSFFYTLDPIRFETEKKLKK
jgi:hypothetical protein